MYIYILKYYFMSYQIEIGLGEVFDRLTILYIKKIEITDYEKNSNVTKEYNYLLKKIKAYKFTDELWELYNELMKVNRTLWDVENYIRQKEKSLTFDSTFIELARSVYKLNDERAELKKRINIIDKSKFIEEKSYTND